jgi:ElaB/YqjD/DUF883 family membrane-anchored ribosome-binding protein
MAHETKDAAAGVASTAGDEARQVAYEAKDQARRLFEQTRTELTDRATSEQERLAQGLRELSDQLNRMAGHADDGVARDLVGDVAGRAGDLAGWLEHRDPGSVLDEARRFARRRPGTFLAVAAGLGVVAGRMSRGLIEEKREEQSSAGSGTGTRGTPSTAPTPTYPVGSTSAATPVSTTSAPPTTAVPATPVSGVTGSAPVVDR